MTTRELTATQARDELKRRKCLAGAPAPLVLQNDDDPMLFDVVPRSVAAAAEDTVKPPDSVLGRGPQRKQLSPYPHVTSFTSATTPTIRTWIVTTLRPALLLVSSPLTNAQRGAVPAAIRALDAFFAAHAHDLAAFLASVPRRVASRPFMSHLCPFAQLVAVTKRLYVQFLGVVGKIEELRVLAECNRAPVRIGSRAFRKRLRGVWGVFHRSLMPSIVYVRAWLDFFGVRLHGEQWGPLLWTNAWAFYVERVLIGVNERRRTATDRRQALQPRVPEDARLVLDPDRLHAFLADRLRAPLPAARRDSIARDPWDFVHERPTMPGPAPEFTRTSSTEGWATHLERLPVRWRGWLGTAPAPVTQARFKLRQYNIDEHRRLVVTRGADERQAAMFRDSGVCLAPGNNNRRQAPAAATLAIAPFFIEPPAISVVANIAFGGDDDNGPLAQIRAIAAPSSSSSSSSAGVSIAVGPPRLDRLRRHLQ